MFFIQEAMRLPNYLAYIVYNYGDVPVVFIYKAIEFTLVVTQGFTHGHTC